MIQTTQKREFAMQIENTKLQALETLPVHRATTIKLGLSGEKIAGLLATLENNFAGIQTPVVQFVSAYNGEGAETIALETGYTAALHTGKRVLFIDAGVGASEGTQKLHNPHVIPLNAFMRYETSAQSPLYNVEGSSFFYTRYQASNSDGYLPTAAALRVLMDKLKTMFDLIVIYAEANVAAQSAPVFSGMTDGCILVVQAEHTRVPVLKQVQQSLENNGNKIIGVVLNKRKLHISQKIYSWLFRK